MNRRLALLSALGFTFVLLAILSFSLTAQAAQVNDVERPQTLILDENFDYGTTAMSLTLASSGNWVNHSGASPYVGYTTTNLSMAGYGSSGIGGAATILTSGSEDANRTFITQTTGTVYFAALVNVSSAGAGTYFMHLKDASTGFRARVFARNDAGILRFGLDTTGSGTYATGAYSYTTTYLLVTKHNLDTGATALYVLDTFSASEPVTPAVSFTTGTTVTVQAVALRQASGGPSAIIDGIRVGNTWAEAVGYAPPAESDLSVTKSGPAAASAGDAIAYTINLSNAGNTTATVSILTDTLPTEVAFVTYTTALPVSFSQPDAQTLVWDLGDVAAGTNGVITVEGTISASLSAGTLFTNTVIASTTATETTTTNNTSSAVTSIGAADLVVIKEGPASVNAGDQIAYTLTYSNAGSLDATGVVLVDQLPAAMTYVTDSLGTGVQVGNTITWTLGSLAVNASGSVVLTATAGTAGDHANVATINGTSADADPLNNVSVFTTTVLGGDPFVNKTGPAVVFGGELISYTIVYGNHGTAAIDVTLTDTLPISFTTANIAFDNSGLNAIDDTTTRSWTATLAAGDQFTFTLALTVPASIVNNTRITNTIAVATTGLGNNPSNDSASAASTVYQFTSIHDIQYVDDPDISDTSTYSGTWVAVEGVVIANPGSFLSSGGLPYRYYIEDPAGGPWSGLYIYRGTANPPGVVEGDHVRLYGLLVEFVQGGSQQTELDLSRAGAFQMVVSSGNPLPAPAVLTTDQLTNAGSAEPWESVLIEFRGARVTNPNIGNGEWNFDDGTGATIGDDNAKAGGNTGFTYVPQLNDYYGFIRGIGWQSFGTYKLEPRYNADVNLDYQVTFVYNDLEDVVQPGEEVQLRGDFTNWATNPITLAHDAGYTVFSATVTLPTTATQSYKYFVTGLSGNAGWDMLNTGNRSVSPTSGVTLQNEYRNVTIGWGNLNGPASQTINLGSPTASIDGQVYVQEVTLGDGPGRGLKAEVGYGNTGNPASWSWFTMAFASQTGNNDVYAGIITPTASGVYSYATRYNGNWGAGNPNSQWVYADLDGIPFSLDQTGVLTVTAPQLTIDKAVTTANPEVQLGEVVTYTFTLSNTGDGTATNVLITDVLPSGITFGGFVQQNGAVYGSGTITWNGSLNATASATVIFTATVNNDQSLYGTDVLNTVQFTSGNGGSGSDSSAFAVVKRYFIYMPLIQR